MSFIKLGRGGFVASSQLNRIADELCANRVSCFVFDGYELKLSLDNLEGERPELRAVADDFEVSGLKLVATLTEFVRFVRDNEREAAAVLARAA